jgi:hypothetical protein
VWVCLHRKSIVCYEVVSSVNHSTSQRDAAKHVGKHTERASTQGKCGEDKEGAPNVRPTILSFQLGEGR